MPQTATVWTPEMVWALPDDGQRYECINGALFVTPAPRLLHQAALSELEALLRPYVRAHSVGQLLHSPADIRFGPHTMVQPDLFVFPFVEGRRVEEWHEIKNLILAVEVLSLLTARADRGVKRKLYQREGVPECWIVDLDAHLIERWRPADTRPEILDQTLIWQPVASAPPLTIDVRAYVGEILQGASHDAAPEPQDGRIQVGIRRRRPRR